MSISSLSHLNVFCSSQSQSMAASLRPPAIRRYVSGARTIGCKRPDLWIESRSWRRPSSLFNSLRCLCSDLILRRPIRCIFDLPKVGREGGNQPSLPFRLLVSTTLCLRPVCGGQAGAHCDYRIRVPRLLFPKTSPVPLPFFSPYC